MGTNRVFNSMIIDMLKNIMLKNSGLKNYQLQYWSILVDGAQLEKKEFRNKLKTLIKNRNKKDKKTIRKNLNKKFNKLIKKSCISLSDFL